jgi:ligand-binding SRPBCC domain-containing protein
MWVDSKVVIQRPVEEVFAFVTNPENDSRWMMVAVSARKITPGRIGRGSRFQQVATFLGVPIRAVWEITEYEPHKKMSGHVVSGPGRMMGGYAFEPVPAGTQLRKFGEIELPGVFKIAGWWLGVLLQQVLERDLRNLKRLLEAKGDRQETVS